MELGHKTAQYEILSEPDGAVRIQFFCDLSGAMVCVTEPIHADTQEQALAIAWESEGKQNFNRCEKCGRWISDAMFNSEVHECVKCAPWENYPMYCHQCGNRITDTRKFCPKCGVLLRYEGR